RVIPLAARERSFSPAEKIALTLRTQTPFFLYQRYSAEAQRVIDRMIAENGYDVVIAEDTEAGLYVRRHHAGRKILTKHSILSLQRMQLATINPSPLKAARDRMYARLIRIRER